MIVGPMAAGMGKTFTCEHYMKVRPHACMATMRSLTKTVHGMLTDIYQVLGLTQNNPARLDAAIDEKRKRNERQTLLIVDKAQNLCDMAVDQLRYFLDQYKCGVALVGNMEIYTRFAGISARGPCPTAN